VKRREFILASPIAPSSTRNGSDNLDPIAKRGREAREIWNRHAAGLVDLRDNGRHTLLQRDVDGWRNAAHAFPIRQELWREERRDAVHDRVGVGERAIERLPVGRQLLCEG